ncbi:serine/threonine-protein kinase STY17 [Pelomyxa schiedti]|nr:serine/threonine-protein kinase STY17 [Pelomyxa schiedti]
MSSSSPSSSSSSSSASSSSSSSSSTSSPSPSSSSSSVGAYGTTNTASGGGGGGPGGRSKIEMRLSVESEVFQLRQTCQPKLLSLLPEDRDASASLHIISNLASSVKATALINFKIPVMSGSRKMKIDLHQTVGSTISKIVRNLPIDDKEFFGLFWGPCGIWLEPNRTLYSYYIREDDYLELAYRPRDLFSLKVLNSQCNETDTVIITASTIVLGLILSLNKKDPSTIGNYGIYVPQQTIMKGGFFCDPLKYISEYGIETLECVELRALSGTFAPPLFQMKNAVQFNKDLVAATSPALKKMSINQPLQRSQSDLHVKGPIKKVPPDPDFVVQQNLRLEKLERQLEEMKLDELKHPVKGPDGTGSSSGSSGSGGSSTSSTSSGGAATSNPATSVSNALLSLRQHPISNILEPMLGQVLLLPPAEKEDTAPCTPSTAPATSNTPTAPNPTTNVLASTPTQPDTPKISISSATQIALNCQASSTTAPSHSIPSKQLPPPPPSTKKPPIPNSASSSLEQETPTNPPLVELSSTATSLWEKDLYDLLNDWSSLNSTQKQTPPVSLWYTAKRVCNPVLVPPAQRAEILSRLAETENTLLDECLKSLNMHYSVIKPGKSLTTHINQPSTIPPKIMLPLLDETATNKPPTPQMGLCGHCEMHMAVFSFTDKGPLNLLTSDFLATNERPCEAGTSRLAPFDLSYTQYCAMGPHGGELNVLLTSHRIIKISKSGKKKMTSEEASSASVSVAPELSPTTTGSATTTTTTTAIMGDGCSGERRQPLGANRPRSNAYSCTNLLTSFSSASHNWASLGDSGGGAVSVMSGKPGGSSSLKFSIDVGTENENNFNLHLAKLLRIKGAALVKVGNNEAALEAIEASLEKDPQNPDALRTAAVAHHNLHNYTRALELFSQSLEIYSDPLTHSCMGQTLLTLGRHAEAKQAFDQSLETSLLVSAVSGRAIALSALKQYSQALLEFDRALELKPKDPNIIGEKAKTLCLLDRQTEALEAINLALAICPGNQDFLETKGLIATHLPGDIEALNFPIRPSSPPPKPPPDMQIDPTVPLTPSSKVDSQSISDATPTIEFVGMPSDNATLRPGSPPIAPDPETSRDAHTLPATFHTKNPLAIDLPAAGFIAVSKTKLFFGSKSGLVPQCITLRDKVTFTNLRMKGSPLCALKFVIPCDDRFTLSCTPTSLILKPGHEAEILLKLNIKCTMKLSLEICFLVAENQSQRKEVFQVANCLKLKVNLEAELSTRIDYTELEWGDWIGEGTFSDVWRGVWRGADVAIKVLKNQHHFLNELAEDFSHEVDLMSKLRSPYVLSCLGAVLIPGKLCLVTEFLPMGSLTDVLKKGPLSYYVKLRMALDCARGMVYLHNSNVVHLDLKTDNILVVSLSSKSPVICKIADFGASQTAASFACLLSCCTGTLSYMAPEVIARNHLSSKADVYSFGIILWQIFTRTSPFSSIESAFALMEYVSFGKRMEIPTQMPEDYTTMVVQCWDQDPALRPTFNNILPVLSTMTLTEEAEYRRRKEQRRCHEHHVGENLYL